jgi:hypothetical protein
MLEGGGPGCEPRHPDTATMIEIVQTRQRMGLILLKGWCEVISVCEYFCQAVAGNTNDPTL